MRALLPMLRDSGGIWVGWTGNSDDHTDPFDVEGVDLHPVPITTEEIELYYEGFSNDALWPLYHDALRESTYSSEQWDAYRAVNERFAIALAEIAPPRRPGVDSRLPTAVGTSVVARAPLGHHHRVLPAHPVPTVRALLPPPLALRGGQRLCSAATSSASNARRTQRTSSPPRTNLRASRPATT